MLTNSSSLTFDNNRNFKTYLFQIEPRMDGFNGAIMTGNISSNLTSTSTKVIVMSLVKIKKSALQSLYMMIIVTIIPTMNRRS